MANLFDTTGAIAPITSNQTAIQAPVQDNTTAQAIQTIGGLATKAAGQIVSQGAVNEAQNILANPASIEVPEIEPYMKRLGDLADGVKAGMQKTKAQTLARATMAEAINQYPYYAQEIRARGATLFGIGSSSTAAGKVNVQQSPEEKALDDYRQTVTQTQLELGVSTQTAQDIIQSQKEAQLRAANAVNFTDDIYIGVNNATIQSQDALFKQLQSSPNGLTPEGVRSFNINVERGAVQLQRQLMDAASKRGAVTKEIFETIDAQVKNYKTNMKQLASDQTMTKWMTEKNDLAAQMITAWGNQNYGGMIQLAKNQVIPDSMKEALLRSVTGDERARALVAANPYLSDIQARTGSLGNILRSAYAASMNNMYGFETNEQENATVNKVSPTDRAAATTLVLNGRGGATFNKVALMDTKGLAQNEIDWALSKAPEGITRWNKPEYQTQFNSPDAAALKKMTIDHELRVVAKTLRARMFSLMDDPSEWANLSVRSAERAIPEQVRTGALGVLGGVPANVITGGSYLDQYTRSRIMDMISVLKNHPEVWEGRAMDAEELVEMMLKNPNALNEGNRARSRNQGDTMNDGVHNPNGPVNG